ncbi:MAG: class I SAM-dependent methyltransferase [Promethearchaeota archaeon]
MKEGDIRPENLMDEELNLRLEDIKNLLRNIDNFLEIDCPACNSEKYNKDFEKFGFTFVKCGQCETIFMNPRPSYLMLKDYYENAKHLKFWNTKIFPISEEIRRERIFIPRAKRVVELCKKYSLGKRILLDVGAGFGTFCEELEKFNFFEKIIAVEPSHELAETCRTKNIEVLEQPIEYVKVSNIDVITNFELIEHLFNPKEFLLLCNKALSDNGLLILTTPNIKGFDLLVLGDKSDNIGDPNHLNMFHIDSLTFLLENCNFEVLEVLTPGKLDSSIVRNKILSGDYDISNNPFLKYLLIDRWDEIGNSFQEFLINNNLSSHLWIVARKN